MIIQKLMIAFGEKGENINEDIASLVKKGLEVEIQRALDVVRVVGNNAVHPGKIDLKDDGGTALALRSLILWWSTGSRRQRESPKCSVICRPVH
jgi:hypothetical protein